MEQFQTLLKNGIEFSARGPKVTLQDIAEIEQMIQAPLPEQYRDYLLHANGGVLYKLKNEKIDYPCSKVYWPKEIKTDAEYVILSDFLSTVHPEFKTKTLRYSFETWKEHLPEYTLPFGHNPGTGYFLIGYGAENRGKIYYWCYYQRICGFIADSFIELIQGIVPHTAIDDW